MNTNKQEQTEKDYFDCFKKQTQNTNKPPKHVYITYAIEKYKPFLIRKLSLRIWDNITKANNFARMMNLSQERFLFIAEAIPIQE